jgi:hypothetical protein
MLSLEPVIIDGLPDFSEPGDAESCCLDRQNEVLSST